MPPITLNSLSLKLTVAFAFSFSFSSSLSPNPQISLLPPRKFLSLKLKPSLSSPPPPPPPPRNLAADIVSLLSGDQQSAKVPANEADEIRSCLRFLVCPSGRFEKVPEGSKRELLDGEEDDDEMVRWPPAPLMELARLAVDSGGNPAVIQRALDPTVIKVPDVEGLAKDKCELTRTPTAFRFANKELNSYFAFLFKLILERAPMAGLNVSLSRYDLFHGHLFLASDTGRLGILFHAKEYPAYDEKLFPCNMGYCQTGNSIQSTKKHKYIYADRHEETSTLDTLKILISIIKLEVPCHVSVFNTNVPCKTIKGSNVRYDDSMNLRNILWLAPLPSNITKTWVAPGTLVILDAHPDGIIYKKLVPEYVDDVRTIYEDDFGEVVVDVNYFEVSNIVPGDNIFIC